MHMHSSADRLQVGEVVSTIPSKALSWWECLLSNSSSSSSIFWLLAYVCYYRKATGLLVQQQLIPRQQSLRQCYVARALSAAAFFSIHCPWPPSAAPDGFCHCVTAVHQPSASTWRPCLTKTSSSRFGTWAAKPASGPTGGVTTPTHRPSFT